MADPQRHPTVLLRHDLPDGAHHFDWMLATDADGPLLTFRVGRDISRDSEPFKAERIGDHRRRYLDYQGPISQGRGSVKRVAEGQCHVISCSNDAIEILLVLGIRTHRLRGIRQDFDWFMFGFG